MNTTRTAPGKQRFLVPSTIGAYLCITGALKDDQAPAVHWLFSQQASPRFDMSLLRNLREQAGIRNPKEIIRQLLVQRIVQFTSEPVHPPQEPMQDALPAMLAKLSKEERAMLADGNGLCIASIGFDHDRTEALSALASKLTAALYHADRDLFDLLDMKYGLTCLFDIASKRLFTFIPMSFGSHRLVAVTEGKAVFIGDTFRDFVWTLWGRYAT